MDCVAWEGMYLMDREEYYNRREKEGDVGMPDETRKEENKKRKRRETKIIKPSTIPARDKSLLFRLSVLVLYGVSRSSSC